MVKGFQSYCLLLLVLLLLLPVAARADCAAPAKPGARICSPSPNATVVYTPAIDFNSTPSFGTEIVEFTAYDNSRNDFESSRTIHPTYTYTQVGCPGNDRCSPCFDTVFIPEPYSYMGNSFTIQKQILHNPRSITTLKAYFDNTVVAMSHDPTMVSPANSAPTGTHITTLQAWDTAGLCTGCNTTST